MLKVDRHARILDHLAETGSTNVQDLTELLTVSGATIRRDLQFLHERGLLERTHGGAVTTAQYAGLGTRGKGLELPMLHRSGQRRAEKRRMAILAAALVPDGAVVGMTGGTTVTEVARILASRQGLTIVTNAVNIAAELVGNPGVRLVVIGGNARSASYELVGPVTERTLGEYHFDITFMGVDGLTPAEGCTTHDEEEAHTDRAFLRSSTRSVVVTDSSKLGKVTFAGICPLSSVDVLITDRQADAELVEALRARGVTVSLA
ncbi:DeoR/GlpR family DNA-binding transcription regulator [Streptomyces sp. NPDC059690]|uniref:DeoR/GlpR family DNA-binding transcription regulator n=1 Tax=Streptomyces sp. NPDC059690 TaxID=3346907 RepID=UPI0036AECCEE